MRRCCLSASLHEPVWQARKTANAVCHQWVCPWLGLPQCAPEPRKPPPCTLPGSYLPDERSLRKRTSRNWRCMFARAIFQDSNRPCVRRWRPRACKACGASRQSQPTCPWPRCTRMRWHCWQSQTHQHLRAPLHPPLPYSLVITEEAQHAVPQMQMALVSMATPLRAHRQIRAAHVHPKHCCIRSQLIPQVLSRADSSALACQAPAQSRQWQPKPMRSPATRHAACAAASVHARWHQTLALQWHTLLTPRLVSMPPCLSTRHWRRTRSALAALVRGCKPSA